MVLKTIRGAECGKNCTVDSVMGRRRNLILSTRLEGMVRMMNSWDGFTGPVNLGNPGEFTMLELAEKVLALTSSKSKIVYKPLPQDDPTQRKPVIDLAKKELDWEPKVALEEGLKKTIAYFEQVCMT